MARRFTTLLLGSISLVALTAPAFADTQSIEEVVVTASKRAEVLKNVPMSVTVIGQDQLNLLNTRSFEDIVGEVPGMSITESTPTHPDLIFRGISAGGDGSTVGTYIDETPFGSSSSLANAADTSPNIDTYDMQQVEVLRGPQGTLYGSSAPSGVLKFVTNAPDVSGFDDSFEVSGTDMERGGGGGSARGVVNVDLTADLGVRGVGFYQRTPGYISDPGRHLDNLNDLISEGGRGTILYQPTDKISVRVSALVQQLDSGDADAEDIVIVGNKPVPKYGNYEEQRTANEPSGVRYFLYNGTINWNLDWATLTSSTSFDILHDYVVTDATGVYGADVQGFLHQGKFTQEVRLASNTGQGPLDWLVGFYYTNETAYLHQDIVTAYHGPQIFPGAFVQLDSDFNETAGFANATYHVTDKFELGVGGRYAHNGQAADEFGLAAASGSSSGGVFTWSADARYHFDDQTMLYARAASGYQPGGPNDLPPGSHPGVPTSFAADTLTNYEVGVKSDLADSRLSFDADVYYINWNQIQLLTVIDNFALNNNGGTARSEGAEADINWIPIDRLNLNLNGAYIDAELTQNTTAVVGGLSGDPLPWAPKWSSNLRADYQFLPMGDWAPYIGASWHYVGERFSDFPAPQIELPAYNSFDARVGVNWKMWSLELYGKNLTDAKGITAVAASGTSAASGLAGTAAIMEPRIVGIVLRGKF